MHFHSTRSDGENKPNEILDRAKAMGLELVTILDHDIVSTNDFIESARIRGIDSLYSSELSI
jgi:predicted metal-dependent phosphoesterase TrpH